MGKKKAVVVFSGGLDSVCIGSTLKSKYELYGITFSYGQKADKEINSGGDFSHSDCAEFDSRCGDFDSGYDFSLSRPLENKKSDSFLDSGDGEAAE